MKSAIEQEIEWCEARMGESANGIDFEKGFIAGLKQALRFEKAVEPLLAPDASEQKTALELPEWYEMAREFFGEIRVFSTDMYNDMNGESILNQLRYAAEREVKAQFSERSERR